MDRKILKLDASLTLLESQLRGVQEEPSGMSEASRQPTDNAVMSKDKTLVPDELPDVACSSSEPSRFVCLFFPSLRKLLTGLDLEVICKRKIMNKLNKFGPTFYHLQKALWLLQC